VRERDQVRDFRGDNARSAWKNLRRTPCVGCPVYGGSSVHARGLDPARSYFSFYQEGVMHVRSTNSESGRVWLGGTFRSFDH